MPRKRVVPQPETAPGEPLLPHVGRRRFLQLGTAAGAGLAATGLTGGLTASASAASGTTTTSGTTAPPVLVSPTYQPLRPPAIPLAVRSPYL